MSRFKLWLDSLYTILHGIYNPTEVAVTIAKIHRHNKLRIRFTSDGKPCNTSENATKHFRFMNRDRIYENTKKL